MYSNTRAVPTKVVARGFSDSTFHDLRHVRKLAHLQRHADLQVTKRLSDEVSVVEESYGHLIANDINGAWSTPAAQTLRKETRSRSKATN